MAGFEDETFGDLMMMMTVGVGWGEDEVCDCYEILRIESEGVSE